LLQEGVHEAALKVIQEMTRQTRELPRGSRQAELKVDEMWLLVLRQSPREPHRPWYPTLLELMMKAPVFPEEAREALAARGVTVRHITHRPRLRQVWLIYQGSRNLQRTERVTVDIDEPVGRILQRTSHPEAHHAMGWVCTLNRNLDSYRTWREQDFTEYQHVYLMERVRGGAGPPASEGAGRNPTESEKRSQGQEQSETRT
jgi:hypothetical protein